MAEKQKRGATGAESGDQRKGRSTRAPSASMQDPNAGDGATMGAPGRRTKENGGRANRGGGPTRGGRSTSGTTTSSAGGRRTSAEGGGDAALRKELRGFAASHREGWNHDEWNHLLNHLRESGYDTESSDEIGRQLERERLAVKLEGVQGVGPARLKKLQEEFGSVWELKNADPERIASASGVSRDVAERIRESVG